MLSDIFCHASDYIVRAAVKNRKQKIPHRWNITDRESNGASCTEIPPEFILYLVGQVKTMCHRIFSSSLSRPPYMRKNEQDCCKNGKTVFSGYHQAITQPRIERGPPADILTRHMHCQHTYTDRCTCAVGWLKTSAV